MQDKLPEVICRNVFSFLFPLFSEQVIWRNETNGGPGRSFVASKFLCLILKLELSGTKSHFIPCWARPRDYNFLLH
jgi:hypothetical protein